MKLIRSYRRTLSITVTDDGEVIVKAPLLLSNRKIEEFVNSKQNWIKKQQEKNIKSNNLSSKYDFLNNVYLNGQGINWKELQEKDKRITKTSFYTRNFYENLLKKAEEIAKNNGFKANFKLCNSKCIWGSCNSKHIIKLNWKLLILDEKLQKYVICHELSHIKQMNHSQKFWNEVEKIDPEYKQNRKELKNFAFLLKEEVLK